MLTSALAFQEALVMDWAVRSARSGSVAASAPAMLASALAFQLAPVMDWPTRSASAMIRAVRSGSVTASARRDADERAALHGSRR